ncbi:MAG: hypothetical protein OQK82_07120 [Candidatus Pacearchaeota archaeon]|nr:hypothetical protein [Candidatus Pacearchaeota archaeon]
MEKRITTKEGLIQIRPIPFYKTVGGVDITTSKEPFTPEDDEMGSLSCFCHYTGDGDKNENAFTLQLRAFKKLTDNSKPKMVVMSMSLNDSEIMAIAKMVTEQREKLQAMIGSTKEKECDNKNEIEKLVSDSMMEKIKLQIDYHSKEEEQKSKHNQYTEALYHNHRKGALEDLLIWIDYENKKNNG